MGIVARVNTASDVRQNAIVTELPALPYPLFVGKISWQDNFDQNVTGTIDYHGLP